MVEKHSGEKNKRLMLLIKSETIFRAIAVIIIMELLLQTCEENFNFQSFSNLKTWLHLATDNTVILSRSIKMSPQD